MRVIASANQKGGCRKTTTAINLSSSLSLKGQKVLLIDFDPQAHATMGLNIKASDLDKTIYDVITPKKNGFLGIKDILLPVKDNFDSLKNGLFMQYYLIDNGTDVFDIAFNHIARLQDNRRISEYPHSGGGSC